MSVSEGPNRRAAFESLENHQGQKVVAGKHRKFPRVKICCPMLSKLII